MNHSFPSYKRNCTNLFTVQINLYIYFDNLRRNSWNSLSYFVRCYYISKPVDSFLFRQVFDGFGVEDNTRESVDGIVLADGIVDSRV